LTPEPCIKVPDTVNGLLESIALKVELSNNYKQLIDSTKLRAFKNSHTLEKLTIKTYIFNFDDHMQRIYKSLNELKCQNLITLEKFKKEVKDLLINKLNTYLYKYYISSKIQSINLKLTSNEELKFEKQLGIILKKIQLIIEFKDGLNINLAKSVFISPDLDNDQANNNTSINQFNKNKKYSIVSNYYAGTKNEEDSNMLTGLNHTPGENFSSPQLHKMRLVYNLNTEYLTGFNNQDLSCKNQGVAHNNQTLIPDSETTYNSSVSFNFQNLQLDIQVYKRQLKNDRLLFKVLKENYIHSGGMFNQHKFLPRYKIQNAAALASRDFEYLWLNEYQEVCESETTNIFFSETDLSKLDFNKLKSLKEIKLITPELNSGILAGVTRKKIIEIFSVAEQQVLASDLRLYPHIYASNAMLGLVEAKLNL
jgi:branched-subunit amino acid aminotransferase/4-amino-4-deoxychorismate lyase